MEHNALSKCCPNSERELNINKIMVIKNLSYYFPQTALIVWMITLTIEFPSKGNENANMRLTKKKFSGVFNRKSVISKTSSSTPPKPSPRSPPKPSVTTPQRPIISNNNLRSSKLDRSIAAFKEYVRPKTPQNLEKFEEKICYCANSRYDLVPCTTSKSADICILSEVFLKGGKYYA
ncbi:uncharacterized protein ACN427_010828 isoform 2-T8 [Glossina fuscipes fuscipes]